MSTGIVATLVAVARRLTHDTYLGVFTVDFVKGTYKKVFAAKTPVGGARSGFLNDVDVLDEKAVFVTDSSAARDRCRFLHAFLEQKPNGRVIKLDVTNGKAKIVLKGLYFTNGIQLLPDRQFVHRCRMIHGQNYAVRKLRAAGPKAGQIEIFADSLPIPGQHSPAHQKHVLRRTCKHPTDVTYLMDKLDPLQWLRKIFVQCILNKKIMP